MCSKLADDSWNFYHHSLKTKIFTLTEKDEDMIKAKIFNSFLTINSESKIFTNFLMNSFVFKIMINNVTLYVLSDNEDLDLNFLIRRIHVLNHLLQQIHCHYLCSVN